MRTVKEMFSYKLMFLLDEIANNAKPIFKKYGITFGNYVTLLLIKENEGINQAALAELNHKDRNVIGKIIEKLERVDYVKRVRVEQDRRAYKLYLTDRGNKLIEEAEVNVYQCEVDIFSKLKKREYRQFCLLLDKMIENEDLDD